MNRLDHAIVGGLVVLLAAITVAIGAPAFAPGIVGPSATPSPAETLAYREGTLGRPISVNPLAARTQVDRDLLALAIDGLVRRVHAWAAAPSGRAPVGPGPYAIVELDGGPAAPHPASTVALPAVDPETPGRASGATPTDTVATPGPTKRPAVATPGIGRIEMRFFDDAASLAAAFRAGDLDAA